MYLYLIIFLFVASAVQAKDDWPVSYDAEKGLTTISISREPQAMQAYTNGIPAWNYDLSVPAAKISSAELKELGKAGGLRIMEVHLAVTDMYYTDARMILEETKRGRFLPVYVQDYNRQVRWPTDNVITNVDGKAVIHTAMDYAGSGCFRNQYQITLSGNRDPFIEETHTNY